MEQALISCFGEMADERTDMQISCAGKNNPRRLHMQTSTIAPASEADLRTGLALKSAAAESPSDEGGRKAEAI